MLIKVPVTVVVGRQDKDIALCIFEGRNISVSRYVDELLPEPAIERIAELEIGDEEIRGHVAVTSFGHSTVKAVDAGSYSGTCYITRGGDLAELPKINLRKSSIISKDFGRWVNVLSLPIFLENIINYETDSIVLAPSRLGENLCITFGYSDSTCIRLVKHFILRARACNSGAMMTVSCVGRIPQIPLEMSLIREDKYILFRIYLNTVVKLHTRFKMLIVVAKGGNIVRRFIAENITENLIETIDEAFELFQNL